MTDVDPALRRDLAQLVLADLRAGRRPLRPEAQAALRILALDPGAPAAVPVPPARGTARRTPRRTLAAVAAGAAAAVVTGGVLLAGSGDPGPSALAGRTTGVPAPSTATPSPPGTPSADAAAPVAPAPAAE